MNEEQPQALRLALLAQDEKVFGEFQNSGGKKIRG